MHFKTTSDTIVALKCMYLLALLIRTQNNRIAEEYSTAALFGFLAWGYQAIQPPAPKICGSPDGPPITAPRIKLRDGRYLAYKEHGVPKDSAKYKVIYVHSFGSCRHNAIVANTISPVSFIIHLLMLVQMFWKGI